METKRFLSPGAGLTGVLYFLNIAQRKEQEDVDAGYLINFVEDLDYDERA